MSTDTELDVCVLEELDFAVPCGHSQHRAEELMGRHGGDATFVAVSYHDCPAVPEVSAPLYYPCCTEWALYVQYCRESDRAMQCPRCGLIGFWTDYVEIIGPLT